MNKLVRTRVLRRLEKNPLGYKSIKQDKLRLFGRLDCDVFRYHFRATLIAKMT